MYARAGSGKHLILGGNATEALRLKSDGAAYSLVMLGLMVKLLQEHLFISIILEIVDMS